MTDEMTDEPKVIRHTVFHDGGVVEGHPSWIRHGIRHSIFRRPIKPLGEMMTDMTVKVPICWDSSEKT
jgi:hypothetical protein